MLLLEEKLVGKVAQPPPRPGTAVERATQELKHDPSCSECIQTEMVADPLLEALGDQQTVAQPVVLESRQVSGAYQAVASRARTAAVLVKSYPEPDLHEILERLGEIVGKVPFQRPDAYECLDAREAVDLADATFQGECPYAVHNGEDTALLYVDLARVLAMAE